MFTERTILYLSRDCNDNQATRNKHSQPLNHLQVNKKPSDLNDHFDLPLIWLIKAFPKKLALPPQKAYPNFVIILTIGKTHSYNHRLIDLGPKTTWLGLGKDYFLGYTKLSTSYRSEDHCCHGYNNKLTVKAVKQS